MEIIKTDLAGVHIIRPRVFEDARGSFVKTYHAQTLRAAGLAFQPQEEFFSTSHREVIRGMHFQLPPHTQARLVYCIAGKVLDVIVDLRKSSPAFGHVRTHELSAANREMLFIPEGFAHGFLALEEPGAMVYLASPVHSPPHDAGIAWDSINFQWPVKNPILSVRDRKFPALRDFQSPF
ncbi:MAG TPA: dTDP-4-dehydrorhamnose 3,5-epimerase [Verrucomicrobiae bacterium]|jgi:dTDP-4-dehydrorhamnose 3,5-epimerase